MNKLEFDEYNSWPSEKLYELVTERDGSQRKFLALHILEQRRMMPLVEAAHKSAISSKWSAVTAIISAIIALAALFLQWHSVSTAKTTTSPAFEVKTTPQPAN